MKVYNKRTGKYDNINFPMREGSSAYFYYVTGAYDSQEIRKSSKEQQQKREDTFFLNLS